MRTSFHIMLKPASGMCNMRCKYCFYADEVAHRSTGCNGIMSRETLRNILQSFLEECHGCCYIAFQGGEPTLAGLDYFRDAVLLTQELNINHCRIEFALQTNGLLIDENWCYFLAENNFLVGISLDGTKELHDSNRVDVTGAGTFHRVMDAISLLKKHHVNYNILTVLTGPLCRSYRKIHQFYKKNGFRYQQYIPCLDPMYVERGCESWSLTPERYAEYLKTAFDCWYQEAISGNKEYHRYFDNLLLMLDRQAPEACGMSGQCGIQYVIESDGSVYPCDFYMTDEYKLGNLNTDTLPQIDAARRKIRFLEDGCTHAYECKHCRWWFLCRGGCRRDRDFFSEGIQRNYYCSAYQDFFEYAYPRLIRLYNQIRFPK